MSALVPRSPFSDLLSLHDSMDRLFGDLWGRPVAAGSGQVPLDVWQEADAVHVRASVPGFSPEDVEITIDGQGILTLKGERKADQERKESDYMLREMRWSSFQRQVSLPGEVKAGDATAEFKDGIVTIRIPKVKTAPPARVKVPVNSKK